MLARTKYNVRSHESIEWIFVVLQVLGYLHCSGEAPLAKMVCSGGGAIGSYGRTSVGAHGRALGAPTSMPMKMPMVEHLLLTPPHWHSILLPWG